MFFPKLASRRATALCIMAVCCGVDCFASPTTIFRPVSTPAHEVRELSLFVILIACGIFAGVSTVAVYVLMRYRAHPGDTMEPPQVFGSTQIELAWTIIPILLLTVLFLGTARVIFEIQDAPKPSSSLDVVVVGHQFWWEFRYPKYNVVTANELHVPISDPKLPRPTFLKLTSADVIHSFWVPRLAGKTDLLPNRVNELWFDPQVSGVYEGQCAQFCGTQHAKMLLRVYVDAPEMFDAWIKAQQMHPQQQPALMQNARARLEGDTSHAARVSASVHGTLEESGTKPQQILQDISARVGRQVFEQQACINCHRVAGTVANGRFGPDLTHLMSRQTIAAGIVENNAENLRRWISDPNEFKPGVLMPAMHLTDEQNAQITAYLITLH